MGRKKKFGEESDFVSVRVPKSKRKEYRIAIKDFVEKKFANDSDTINSNFEIKVNKNSLEGYQKFEEFIKEIKKEETEQRKQ